MGLWGECAWCISSVLYSRVMCTSAECSLPQLGHGVEDVIGLEGQVLHTGAKVLLQEGLDLHHIQTSEGRQRRGRGRDNLWV